MSMVVNQDDLAAAIEERLGLAPGRFDPHGVRRALDAFQGAILATLMRGGMVTLAGFGTFYRGRRGARRVANAYVPGGGLGAVLAPMRRVACFRASPLLRRRTA